MTREVPNEKELLSILELAKIGEKQIISISSQAEALALKCQRWYEEATGQKLPEQPTIHYGHYESAVPLEREN